jgi:hypothetical protein
VNVLDLLIPEPGAFYVMDRDYPDFERLHVLQHAGSFFVTRAKSNMDARRVYSAPSDRWDASRKALPTAREHLAAAVVDGRLYVIGGRWGGRGNLATVEMYDPAGSP